MWLRIDKYPVIFSRLGFRRYSNNGAISIRLFRRDLRRAFTLILAWIDQFSTRQIVIHRYSFGFAACAVCVLLTLCYRHHDTTGTRQTGRIKTLLNSFGQCQRRLLIRAALACFSHCRSIQQRFGLHHLEHAHADHIIAEFVLSCLRTSHSIRRAVSDQTACQTCRQTSQRDQRLFLILAQLADRQITVQRGFDGFTHCRCGGSTRRACQR